MATWPYRNSITVLPVSVGECDKSHHSPYSLYQEPNVLTVYYVRSVHVAGYLYFLSIAL